MTVPRGRSILAAALVVAAFVNVHGLLRSVSAHARFRDAAFATLRARATGIRASIGQRIALGGPRDRDSAMRQAMAEGAADAVEAFDLQGQKIASLANARGGTPAPWLSEAQIAALRSGAVLVGPEPGGQGERLVAYALVSLPDGPIVLRLMTASPELAEDRRDWQRLFLGHAATLLVLLLVAGIVLGPRREEAEAAPPRALVAYEEAMERLRDHGEELTVRHQAERRQMEDVLRDKEALARAGELTAGIVHEVRNGLGTIVGHARLIENTAPDGKDSARSIREECETLETVIRRFVDFVKRETLTLAPVDLTQMLRRVIARESRRAGAAVAIDAAPAVSLVADEELLERAFENLVRNARDAAGASGRVWVSASAGDARSVVVKVADDGPGLAPATRSAIRPFFTTKAGGLGLGLAITLKIVRLHDGELTLGDRPGGGALVTVRLPASGPATGQGVTEGIGGGTAEPSLPRD